MFTSQSKSNPETNSEIRGKEDRNRKTLPAVTVLETAVVQKKKNVQNHTGLPDNLKQGVENLSGYNLDDVKVHYNSDKPAQLQALAYAQGNNIHLGPGQEKHLPHEAWHVVQQKQGRVRPTVQMKTGIAVNDDKGLESEADVMGQKASGFAPFSLNGIAEPGKTAVAVQKMEVSGNTYQLLSKERFLQLEETFRASNWETFHLSQFNAQSGLPKDTPKSEVVHEKADAPISPGASAASALESDPPVASFQDSMFSASSRAPEARVKRSKAPMSASSSSAPRVREEELESQTTTTTTTVSAASAMENGSQEEEAPNGNKLIESEMGTGEFGFTTFGMEYEMIPYLNSNAIANTAHVKLAIGNSMPFKDFKELLVTDSDNVIEYVTPVFVIPYEYKDKKNIVEQAAEKIQKIKNLLINLKKRVTKHSSFGTLIRSDEMAFANWNLVETLNITHKEIDEKTDVSKLKTALQSAPGHEELLESITLGTDAKNAKHNELKKPQTGSAMQTTILLPLDVVAGIAKNLLNYSPPPVRGGKSTKKPAAASSSSSSAPVSSYTIIDDLTELLSSSIKGKNGSEALNLIHLFGQRMNLVLSAPNAVKFQANYQKIKFDMANAVTSDGSEKKKVAKMKAEKEKAEKEKDDLRKSMMEEDLMSDEELAAYRSEDADYFQSGTNASPNNFHSAHSAIKDRLDIWTRIHMDDLVKRLKLKLTDQDQAAFGNYIFAQKPFEIWGKIISLMPQTEPHEPVGFLDENPEYVDLRQDTLREIQVINGTAWVLVEIRNLTDETIAKIAQKSKIK